MTRSDAFLDYALRHTAVQTLWGSAARYSDGYTLERRTCADDNFIYLAEGGATWTLGDQHWPLHRGDLLLVPEGVPHHAVGDTPHLDLISLHLHATLPGGNDVFPMLGVPRLMSVQPGGRLDKDLRGAADVMRTATRPGHWHLLLESWGRLVVLEYLHHAHEAGMLSPKSVDPLIHALLDELDRRVPEPTTLADLSRFTGYSGAHVNRVFGEALGMTPLQYLARLRVETAKALLQDRDLPVAAVAERVGYDDPYYFSRFFSQKVGCSPSDYRALARSESPSPGG